MPPLILPYVLAVHKLLDCDFLLKPCAWSLTHLGTRDIVTSDLSVTVPCST